MDLRGFGVPVSAPELDLMAMPELRAYPNPSGGWVRIDYTSRLDVSGGSSSESDLQGAGILDHSAGMIHIFDTTGRLVRILTLDAAGGTESGFRGVVVWDGRDARDRPVARDPVLWPWVRGRFVSWRPNR